MKVSRITRFAFVLAVAVLIVGLSACDELVSILSDDEMPQMESLSGEISIGVVLPQTGVLGPGEFGPGALVMENGFNMALEEINNAQLDDATLKFIIEDDRSTTEGAIEALNKLIHQDKVPAILGVWTSHVAQSVFPIAQENQVVALSPVVIASGLTDIGDFIFRASHSTDVLIPGGVKVTQEQLGYQQVATISDSVDLFSRDSDAVFKKTFAENGIEVVATETFATGETDFSTQLTRIKMSNPEAIFISAQQIELIQILIQGRGLGIPSDIPFISIVLSRPDIQSAGDAAEGAITFASWFSGADTPGNQAFIQNYSAKYGMEPDIYAAQSYAAVYILAEAIANAQLTGSMATDSTAIRDALTNIRDFDTVLGQFSFDTNGDADYAPIVLIVKNGKLQVFE
jgi:branched-chain amino acid transport system substrate-binding protein